MYSKKNKNGLIKEAVRLALFASLATATITPVAFAQQNDEDVEEVVVTGSRITRSTIQESGNLVSMDRQQIDATGNLMIADVLRSSPLNSYGSFSERSGSSAQSNATIDLRGLGSEKTLVLINGHRVPGSPNLGAASVNINMIPMAAVERIEMLPDAASAVYGSDAEAGVVNIIMKKNYDGLTFSVRKGSRANDDGGDSNISLLGGMSNDRGNITFAIEHNTRDAIFDADRDYTKAKASDADGDGVIHAYLETDGISFYGKTLELYDPNTGYDKLQAAVGCPTTGGFQGVMGAGAFGLPNDTLCTFAYANISANKAKLERTNTYLDATFNINDNTEFFLNALFSRVESFGRYAPPAAAWENMPVDYPDSPFDIAALIASGDISNIPDDPLTSAIEGYQLTGYYRWTNVGNRDNFVTDTQYDLTTGLRGDITDDVSYEVYTQYSRYDSKEFGRYYLSNLGRDKVLEDGIDPFSAAGAGIMRATTSQDNFTIMKKLYGHIQWSAGDLFDAGDVIVLAGAEKFDTDYANQYDAASEAGLVGGSAGNSSAGDRSVNAFFVEAVMPMPSDLEVDVALRYDNYSDFGSKVSPSLGVNWAANEDVKLRARYSKGFRAPALSDLYGPQTFSAEEARDYKKCIDDAENDADPATTRATAVASCPKRQFDTYYSSNSDLGSEQSSNFSLGVNWAFVEGWKADVAYWNIKITDLIGTPSTQSLFYAEAASIDLSNPASGVYVDRSGAAPVVYSTGNNDGELNASGLDIQIDGMIETDEMGTFTPSLILTKSLTYEQQAYYKGPVQDTAGFSYQPELRWVMNLGWNMGPHSVEWSANFIGDYAANDSIVVGDDGIARLEASSEKVDTWTTMNLAYSYDADKYGKIKIGATNITNKDPVLDSEGKFPSDSYNLYDQTGRVVYTEYTVEF